jgi:surface antigen
MTTCITPANAAWATNGWTQHIIVGPTARWAQTGTPSDLGQNRGYPMARRGRAGGPLQCVPFARENSGIELTGNATNWWENAAGIYERGSRPEVGSVLNFRSTSRMRLGHVAVVSRVVDGRNVEIDHANWAYPGGVSRSISVVDVSAANDWSAVRVALGQSSTFGSIYPTYGFIYDRADHGTLVANSDPLPAPVLNPAAADARPANERSLVTLGREADEEVAEVADDAQPRTRHAASSRTTANKPAHGATMRRIATRSPSAIRTTHGRRGAPNT